MRKIVQLAPRGKRDAIKLQEPPSTPWIRRDILLKSMTAAAFAVVVGVVIVATCDSSQSIASVIRHYILTPPR